MTARERVERTLNFEQTDRVPIFDIIQHIPLIEHCTGKKLTPENGLNLLCETIAENLDATRGVAPPQQERIFTSEDGFTYKAEWWTTWQLERPFKDVAGLKEHIKWNIEQIADRKPGEIWTFAGKADVWGTAMKSPRDTFLELQEKVGDTVLFPTESPVGLDTAYYRAGLQIFSYTYADDPKLVSAWLGALCENEVQRVHEVADYDLSPVALVYSDIANKHSLIFSPVFLRREFFPRLKRVVDAWRSHGIKVIFHSDGNLWEVMDDFVAAGIDGINPLEPLSGMDLALVRERYPNLALMGGIDASQLLAFGAEAEVEAAVKRAIDATSPRGGLLLGSSTEIHPGCKLENVLKMWETAMEYGRSD